MKKGISEKDESGTSRAYLGTGRTGGCARLRVLGIGLAAVIAGGAVVVIHGCKSMEISVQEARQIAAGFRGIEVIAPPRHVDDIVAQVEAESGRKREGVEQALSVLKEPIPKDASVERLSAASARRGFAALAVSRDREAVENFGLAASCADKSSRMSRLDRAWCHFQHGWALLVGGNAVEAVKALERATRLIPAAAGNPESEAHWREQGHLLAWEGFLAAFSATVGDLDGAEKALGRCLKIREDFVIASRSWPSGYVKPYEAGMMDAGAAFGQAMVLDLRGRHAEAEKYHAEALDALVIRMGWLEWKWVPRSQMEALFRDAEIRYAANLRDQGRLEEAESRARAALADSLKVLGRYNSNSIYALQTLSTIFLAQGRFSDVERLSRINLQSLEQTTASADSISVIRERRLLAQALAGQGRWEDVLGMYKEISESLKENPESARRLLSQDPSWAIALMKMGRLEDALRVAEDFLEENTRLFGPARYETAEAKGVRAMALSALDRVQEAAVEFESALDVLVEARRKGEEGAASSALRVQRFGLIVEAYAELLHAALQGKVKIRLQRDPVEEIFRLTELARGGGVREALSASAARAKFRDPALAGLIRSEQDSQKQISALFNLLSNALDPSARQASQKAVEDLRGRISRLRAAKRALLEEINRRSVGYMEMINPSPPTFKAVQSMLRDREALVSIYVGERSSYAWAIPRTGEVSFECVPIGRRELHEWVSRLRKALDPSANFLDQIPEFDLGLAYRIYSRFLLPIARGWDRASSLVVVANGPLGFLPLSVLPTSETRLPDKEETLFTRYRAVPWLSRKVALTSLPSAASLMSLRSLPAGDPTRRPFVGFGDPRFAAEEPAKAAREAETRSALRDFTLRAVRSAQGTTLDNRGIKSVKLPMLQRLPETADEVRSIAISLGADPDKDVFIGPQASEKTIKDMNLFDRQVVAFATHALMPGDLDGLWQPALALSSPAKSGTEDDGLLTMGEVLGLKLDADWVVLSACNTGAGDGAGAEAVSGLGSAFFYAGTRAILVSNWPVETTSAKTLTTELFRRQATHPQTIRSRALQQAMLDLIDRHGYRESQGKMLFSYAHPVFWAPFALVGDGG